MTHAWKVTSFWGNHFYLKSHAYKINFPRMHSPSFRRSYDWRMGRLIPAHLFHFVVEHTSGKSGRVQLLLWLLVLWGEKKCLEFKANEKVTRYLLLSLCSPLPPQRTPPSWVPFCEIRPSLILSEREMCRCQSPTDRALQKFWWVIPVCANQRGKTRLDRNPKHRRLELQLLFLHLIQCSDLPAMFWQQKMWALKTRDSSLWTKVYLHYSVFTLLNLPHRPQ